MKNDLAEARATISGAQAVYLNLVAKATAADDLVSRLQAELAGTRSATSGADGSGQARANAQTKVSQEFVEGLINDCTKYAWEQMQVVKAAPEEKHNELEQRVTETANEELVEQRQAQVLY